MAISKQVSDKKLAVGQAKRTRERINSWLKTCLSSQIIKYMVESEKPSIE